MQNKNVCEAGRELPTYGVEGSQFTGAGWLVNITQKGAIIFFFEAKED